MFRATVVYLFMGAYIALVGPPAMLWTALSGNSAFLYRLARLCIRTAGLLAGIRVRIRGRDKILPGITYVFVSNHRSNCDGPVLCHAIPRDWAALVKREIMRLPILSLVLKQVHFVPLERLNPKQAHAGIELGADLLKTGKSFVAFPEGTRSRDGRLGEFKMGIFIMALKAGVPIVPVTILNSARVQPPRRYGIGSGCIEVVFHKPVETNGMTLDDRSRLMHLVRQAIASALPESVGSGQSVVGTDERR
jgi:1-acyl-sn-glycerol-3-phosphate acyltransferase